MNHIIRSIRLYFYEAWFSYRALFDWQRIGPYLSAKLFFPLFTMLLFVFMGRFAGANTSFYIVIGNILLLPTMNGVNGVSLTIGNERIFGTLPYLIGSPAPRLPLFMGRALFHILDGMSTVVLALPIALFFFKIDLSGSNLPLTLFCIFVISLTSTGLGMIMGSIALLTSEGWVITATVSAALYILCGVNFPPDILPHALQLISYSLPLTRGIMAARLALSGASWPAVASLIYGELLVGLIYGLVGYGLFLIIERISLKNSQLDHF
jgi:ABC-2 type transport system permease protein